MQWKDVDRRTFTRICNSAINCLNYGNSFCGIQTDCLWQTTCILERQLLVSITQSYSMSSSRNSDESCHLGVWLFHDNAPALKSLVAEQALCSCASLDLAPSNYFQIRNLKYRLRGTWFIDEESQKIAVKAWSECQNRKFYFQGINSWEQKLKICIDVAWEHVKKWEHVWYNMLTFYSQVVKLFDRPLCMVNWKKSVRTHWRSLQHGQNLHSGKKSYKNVAWASCARV